MITNPLFRRAEAAMAFSCHPEREASISVSVATEVSASQAQGGRRFGRQEAT